MNLFQAIFGNTGASVAIVFGNRQITYDELRRDTLRTAQALGHLGIAPGDRVALLLHDSPEWIAAFIAICSMGAIAVPINMSLRPQDQCLILHNSGARLALVESDIRSTLLTGASEKLQSLKDVVVVDRKGDESGLTLQQLQREASSIETLEFPDPAEDQPAFILYTSGSTGEPKGAVHCQSDIFHTNAGFCRQVLNLQDGDRLFSSSRLPFAYGLGNSLTFPLLNGMTSILCFEKPAPEIINQTLLQFRPTIFFGVPVVYNLLLEHHRSGKPLDCTSLRLCVSAGEALPAHLGEEWEKEFGVQLLDGIGSTEMLHMFMSNHYGDVRYGTSGKLLKGYEAKLLTENGEAEVGQEGNLWIKGNSAALYYWEKPEETQRTFIDGWVRTGDLYKCDEEGFWTHMGRSDDVFKSSGKWVSPVEVEGVLIRQQDVARVAIVEDFDANGLPGACAFVVCKELESDRVEVERRLRELAASALPKFKRPVRYLFVEELPYTATGKIQRFKLRQQLRAGKYNKAEATREAGKS
jgi:benzoate-CoA ligase